MSYLNTFERYEIKYLLTNQERQALCELMEGRMKIDQYGRTTIRNLYYDTDDMRLVRHSLEKPVYKEKLRVRSYSRITSEDDVYVELKKKYESVVYKRRIALPEHEATDWLVGGKDRPADSQIAREIDAFRAFYTGIRPVVYLSYEREAYFPTDGSDIRITLDSNILARDYDLTLLKGAYGENVIGRDVTVLEVKVPGAIPLWLVRFLSGNGIRKTSFSKYGMYYTKRSMNRQVALTNNKGGIRYA